MLLLSKLEPKPFPLSTISLFTKPASKPNHVMGTPPPKQVTLAKNNKVPNVTTTIKDLNQPNYSMELLPPHQMTRFISDSFNNIPLGTNVIDVNNNIFGLLFHIQNFLAFSTQKILMLTKIKILYYLVLM